MFRDTGTMVISLDFELMWGFFDIENLSGYQRNIEGAKAAVLRILQLFQKYDIHATWGIVGMMLYSSVKECIENQPIILPQYAVPSFSPYLQTEKMFSCDPSLLFAEDLISRINKTKHQEIASHTYSHYYCVEKGQTKEAFEQDTRKMKEVFDSHGLQMKSVVFPRNQYNPAYAGILKQYGIENYRGNENARCFQSDSKRIKNSMFRRAARFFDDYMPLFGNQCYSFSEIQDQNGLNNIRSSRFFRPYRARLAFFEPMRLRRIKRQMTYAAQNNMVFHLWWHPHNFGINTDKNLENLEKIFRYYKFLNKNYHMTSLNMRELGDKINASQIKA